MFVWEPQHSLLGTYGYLLMLQKVLCLIFFLNRLEHFQVPAELYIRTGIDGCRFTNHFWTHSFAGGRHNLDRDGNHNFRKLIARLPISTQEKYLTCRSKYNT